MRSGESDRSLWLFAAFRAWRWWVLAIRYKSSTQVHELVSLLRHLAMIEASAYGHDQDSREGEGKMAASGSKGLSLRDTIHPASNYVA
jgi:hypothetical protein